MFKFTLLLLLISTLCLAKQPSAKNIQQYLGNKEIDIQNITKVYLQDNERAYLAQINFERESSSIQTGVALIRPELDEAKLLTGFSKDYTITDLDHDGVSEIISVQQQQQKDYNVYTKSILQLQDYEAITIHSVRYKKQTHCTMCTQEEVQWIFQDLTSNKIKDLSQTYSLHVRTASQKIRIKEHTQNLIFDTNTFSSTQKMSKLSIPKISIGKNVIDRKVQEQTQHFDLKDAKVYCLLDFANVKEQEKLTYHWIHESLGEVAKVQQKVHPAKRFRTWVTKTLLGKKEYIGEWLIVVTDKNEYLLTSKRFSVK